MKDGSDHRGWLGPSLLIVGAMTAFRLALLPFAEIDLFVDEAQYWLWGQEFAFGYYSKPPLVGWVIGAVTTLAGSDAPFWVRAPAPLFHAATALVLGAIAARLFSARAGWMTAAAYVTLPMVTVGSLLISTDTIMFPFLAAALALYLRLIAPGGGGRPHLAAAAGICLGLAFLAKYAAAYYILFGTIAALGLRTRPDGRDGLTILGAFAVVAAPNLLWNLANGLTTLSHTVDNTGWRDGVSVDPSGLVRFLAEQFLVVGPVVFVSFLLGALALLRRGPGRSGALLLALSLPIVAVISVQAAVSGANANWAASAYLAGVLVAVPWLLARWRGWLILSFVLNGAVAVALPVLVTQAEAIVVNDRLLFRRYLGLDELSRSILDEAGAQDAVGIVATERAVLADLFHTGRNAGVPVFSWPHDGSPRHHYDQRHALPRDVSGPLLAVTRGVEVPPCGAAAEGSISPGPGAYEGSTFRFWLVPADCWTTE